MIDVGVLLTFKLIMMTTTVHWVKILAKFWHLSDNR